MITDIGEEEFAGRNEPAQVVENLLAIDGVEFQQQMRAEVVNPAERQELALPLRERRQHAFARFERLHVVADQTVEELHCVLAAQLQLACGREVNHCYAAAYRVVFTANIAVIIWRQCLIHALCSRQEKSLASSARTSPAIVALC